MLSSNRQKFPIDRIEFNFYRCFNEHLFCCSYFSASFEVFSVFFFFSLILAFCWYTFCVFGFFFSSFKLIFWIVQHYKFFNTYNNRFCSLESEHYKRNNFKNFSLGEKCVEFFHQILLYFALQNVVVVVVFFLINWIHAIVRQKSATRTKFFFFGRTVFDWVKWFELNWIERGCVSSIDLVCSTCFSSHNEFSLNFAIYLLAWLSIIIEFKCFVWVSIEHWSIFIEIFVLNFDCVCVCVDP